MLIQLNAVYDIEEPKMDTVRILYADKDKVIVVSLIHKDSVPYQILYQDFERNIIQETAKLNDNFPAVILFQLTEKQNEKMEYYWKLLGGFLTDEPNCYENKTRSKFISAKSKETGIQRKQIERLLYRYWAGGKTKYALCPDYTKRGAPGKSRMGKSNGRPIVHETERIKITIGDTELQNIKCAVTKYYTKHTKYQLTYAYKKMIDEYYTDSETGKILPERPTENQFRYHAGKFINDKQRVGEIEYQKNRRGLLGSSRSEANGPGDVYQIDATVADVYLVSHFDRSKIVGRPTLYFVTDVFSRMIVGVYASLSPASWQIANQALLNAFSDKKTFCEKYGISITDSDWPCKGLPRELIVDNGELVGKNSNAIIEGLGITVKNEPAWRPDLKGIVESRFRLFNIKEKAALPGAVLPDANRRGSPDYRLNAKLNLSEFIKIVILFCLNHNKRRMENHPQLAPDIIKDGVPAIPVELWNWGIKNRTGALREMSRESMEMALANKDTATVTKKGIKFHNLMYVCNTANDEDWFSKARINGTWKVDIAYFPDNTSYIYLKKGPTNFEECKRTQDSLNQFGNMSFYEMDFIINEQKEEKARYRLHNLQTDIDHNREIETIIENAENESKLIPFDSIKKSAKSNEIRKNRKAENEFINAKKIDKKESVEKETKTQEDSSLNMRDFYESMLDDEDE